MALHKQYTSKQVSKKITDRIFTLTKLNRDGEIFQQFERVMDDEQELDFLACNVSKFL